METAHNHVKIRYFPLKLMQHFLLFVGIVKKCIFPVHLDLRPKDHSISLPSLINLFSSNIPVINRHESRVWFK